MATVVVAPGALVMAAPGSDPNCPAGLEYLTQVDQLLVQQAVNLLEAFTGIECQTQFTVKNSMGQTVFAAAEESGFCTRQCCAQHRGFTMHLADNLGQICLKMVREFKCCAGCCWCGCLDCCAYEVSVEAPPGNVIGYVRQACSIVTPCFEIFDANHDAVMQLTGPTCLYCCIGFRDMCTCCCDIQFEVQTMAGDTVGKVSKQWSGLVKEIFTEADNFGISFPMDLDVKIKATLLGATFLINMMFFENNQNDQNN